MIFSCCMGPDAGGIALNLGAFSLKVEHVQCGHYFNIQTHLCTHYIIYGTVKPVHNDTCE